MFPVRRGARSNPNGKAQGQESGYVQGKGMKCDRDTGWGKGMVLDKATLGRAQGHLGEGEAVLRLMGSRQGWQQGRGMVRSGVQKDGLSDERE